MSDETPAEHLIQSHFVRAGRQGSDLKKRRDWSLFMFFRVLSQQEATQSLDRILGPEVAAVGSGPDLAQLEIEMLSPTLWTPFVPDPVGEPSLVDETAPVHLFLRWLKAITGDGYQELMTDLNSLRMRLNASTANTLAENASAGDSQSNELLERPGQRAFVDIFSSIESLANDSARDHGLEVLRGGLARVCAYEVIREIVRATEGLPVARSSADEGGLVERPGDRSPIEIAFTHSGLGAVGVNGRVLNSFPDVFKEGMAARAARLGDVGKSSPSQWDGELGQSAIHGMLVGGFAVEGAKEQDWERLRREIRLFNEAGPDGAKLRTEVGLVFRSIGLEILHIELGQDPYEVSDDGTVTPLPHRYEHFGFRDGISQPTMDLPGSGTPAGNGSWIPVAPGEIFLGAKDEDGCVQAAPSHTDLRNGGTYIVFRKLQQDVAGFRSYLASARPGSKSQQDRLAAQFVGRWQNGVSLVRAPAAQPDLGEDQEVDLNNFRYVEEDPSGRYCPLGAHARRANPRDIGGQTEAKRHRILRRGMAYGGPFLPESSAGDGRERGLLFIAANARIDVQFELIQSRWINGGEFLGQAGLNKCPITGANAGGPGDQFVSPDNAAPLNRIPRFVQTRGGDYFFAPGIDGLKAIANGKITEPNSWVPNETGHNSAKTEDAFSAENIRKLMELTLTTGPCVQTFKPVVGAPHNHDEPAGNPIVFVGQHAQVKEVLSGANGNVGVLHYIDSSERMMSGARILISTETGDPELREPMKAVLKRAWDVLNPYNAFNAVLDGAIGKAIGRTKQVGGIDLVHDLAVDPVYQLVANVYGVPGPNWLTELAVALPFGRRHVSELHPDWLAMLSGKAPQNPRLATLQVWSILMFSDLIGNIRSQEELKVLAMEAASEFTLYLEQLLIKEQAKPRKKPGEARTLVEAFCAIEGETFAGKTFTKAQHYRIARLLLTELVPSALAVIPATFGSLISALLDNRINLSYVVPYLDKMSPTEGVKRLIYEMNRLNPTLPLLQRYAKEDVTLKDGSKIDKGNWIGALLIAANLDARVFPQPRVFSLGPQLQAGAPKRDLGDYIMFGGLDSDRECFGRDRLAMMALMKFIRGAARFPGLRRVAGPGGEPVQILRTTIGLPARFARF